MTELFRFLAAAVLSAVLIWGAVLALDGTRPTPTIADYATCIHDGSLAKIDDHRLAVACELWNQSQSLLGPGVVVSLTGGGR